MRNILSRQTAEWEQVAFWNEECAGAVSWAVITHGSTLLSSRAWRPLGAGTAGQTNGASSARGSALSWRALEKNRG